MYDPSVGRKKVKIVRHKTARQYLTDFATKTADYVEIGCEKAMSYYDGRLDSLTKGELLALGAHIVYKTKHLSTCPAHDPNLPGLLAKMVARIQAKDSSS